MLPHEARWPASFSQWPLTTGSRSSHQCCWSLCADPANHRAGSSAAVQEESYCSGGGRRERVGDEQGQPWKGACAEVSLHNIPAINQHEQYFSSQYFSTK